jgi:hypothetical protein
MSVGLRLLSCKFQDFVCDKNDFLLSFTGWEC